MQDQNTISTLIEQNKLLMEMMCAMRAEMTELKTIKAEVSNLHRIFNKVADEKPIKKLTPKQKREMALKEAIEQEKAEILLRINQT